VPGLLWLPTSADAIPEPTEAWSRLDASFEAATRPCREGATAPVVLFSGGVDSALLAWELRRTEGASLFTVGLPGSQDLRQAARAAAPVGLPWVGRELGEADLLAADRELEGELADVPGPRRGIFVALALAIGLAPPGDLVCGQGADELFLGYAHYRGLGPEAAAERARSDLRRLVGEDWPRTQRIAARRSRRIAAPFLDPAFVRAASEVPLQERLPGVATKEYFRRWAEHRDLPAEAAGRPKRAIQYGFGVDRWLRRRRRATG
jgi:asparagine synthase (glutamine-hydrolysing)